ncbi:hypothetical protein BR93DRAFT_596892 [Coniochaeta sp. PMI_546]|nr:hypothetical protein BR93DRAFT_596892 [Coniochaeta sp. PMI_546]
MSWFGVTPLKKFPAPVLRPMAPFFAAGLIIAYGVNAAQNSYTARKSCFHGQSNRRAATYMPYAVCNGLSRSLKLSQVVPLDNEERMVRDSACTADTNKGQENIQTTGRITQDHCETLSISLMAAAPESCNH